MCIGMANRNFNPLIGRLHLSYGLLWKLEAFLGASCALRVNGGKLSEKLKDPKMATLRYLINAARRLFSAHLFIYIATP